MKMARILMGCLLAAALLPLLTGCGGGGDDDNSQLLPEALTYVAEPDGSTMEVWMMAPDGTSKLLLADNPEWVWTQIEGIPLEDGFLNKWHVSIPVGPKIIECIGVCFVQFDEQGKIRRNEVYFDRHELVTEILKHAGNKKR